jgi:DNA-binding transcriptional ArsR family regulator
VPIRFRVDDRDDIVAFALSPLCEVMLSLHVLLAPKVHALQHPWIRAMRRLSPALKREARAFAFVYEDALPDTVIPPTPGARPRFDEQVAAIAALSETDFAYDVARPLFHYLVPDAGGQESMAIQETRTSSLDRAAYWGDESRTLAALAFDDPAELRRRFLDFLNAYWDEVFALEWDRLEPLLEADIESARAVISEWGLYEFLERQPVLGVDRDAGVILRPSPHEHEVEVTTSRPLILVPSAYVWPHVRVSCDEPWPLAIVYPAAFASAARELAPPELVRTFRALGDATRLRALRLIAERPRSTEELATLVGMSESGLSKHVRVLVEAGLVARRRRGYYVLHSLDRQALATLPRELADFVDGGRRR